MRSSAIVRSIMSSISSSPNQRFDLVMDRFAARQFDPANKAAATHIAFDSVEFTRKVNEIYEEKKQAGQDPLIAGYADFCKHIFVPNFVGARASYLKITDQNRHLLKSGYVARTEKELPVLTRWFPADQVEAPLATHLDVILYSRAQINIENAAMGQAPETYVNSVGETVIEDAPWGIISIKPQLEDYETPMTPITAMRNALSKSEGGSGVALQREAYMQAVAFWSEHAMISSH